MRNNQNPAERAGLSFSLRGCLADANLSSSLGFAGELGFLDSLEGDDTGLSSVDGVVAAHVCALTSDFRSACLADEHFAGVNFLATETLDAEALARVVVDVFT